MKTRFLYLSLSLLLICRAMQAQVLLPELVVTATRTENKLSDIPTRVDVISRTQVSQYPANRADDLFRFITGANVDRWQGIFNKSASITLRGINSAQRVLVLLDGVPLNKSDGGAINWNRISPDEIERIEVVKGPASALYGGNAMAGVISIISKEPEKDRNFRTKLTYGTYNTLGIKLSGSERYTLKKGTLSWKVYGNTEKSNGYVPYPDSLRDSINTKTYLSDAMGGIQLVYKGEKSFKSTLAYDYYHDKIGDGVKIYDPDGGFTSYQTNTARVAVEDRVGKGLLQFNINFGREDFLQQKESLKKEKTPPYAVTAYQLYQTKSLKSDVGAGLNYMIKIPTYGRITAGADFRNGGMNSRDTYYTSTDLVDVEGNLLTSALYIQNEWVSKSDRLHINIGGRYDYVTFRNGSFSIAEPSAVTSILMPYVGDYKSTNWSAFSPKLGIRYEVTKPFSVYSSYSSGFRSPILDDMCRNGNITKGLKLANPDLKPEKLKNYELGCDWKPGKKISLNTAVFYSIGTDFQYFVGTGDSIYSGTIPKPVLKRENIGKVGIGNSRAGTDSLVTRRYNAAINIQA